MIRLERHGIVLRQIGPDDIEQVRVWRNRPDVTRYMAYRDEITSEMQRQWYAGVQDRGDLFFIICDAGKEVGVIDIKQIDFQAGEAEGGIFMAGEAHCNSLTPFRASLCTTDFAFEVLRLARLRAHILDDNPRAIRYNKMLGYEPTDVLVNGGNRRYYLRRERYYGETRPRLVRLLGPNLDGVSS